jgi:hypothetical protein
MPGSNRQLLTASIDFFNIVEASGGDGPDNALLLAFKQLT